jgi:hypothetical protein
MGRFFIVLAVIISAATTDAAFAKGGLVHLFVTHPPSASQPPSYREFLAGCGRGRYRDPATQRCRGPADVGR